MSRSSCFFIVFTTPGTNVDNLKASETGNRRYADHRDPFLAHPPPQTGMI
jgi:hypothetical protein